MFDPRGSGVSVISRIPCVGAKRAAFPHHAAMGCVLAILVLASPACPAAEKTGAFLPLARQADQSGESPADRRFVESVVRIAGSSHEAARQLMDKGWEYVRKHDVQLALRRFNQAYLLVPESAEAHWGLGTVASQMGHPRTALLLLEKALGLQEKQEAALLVDIGFAHIQIAAAQEGQQAESAAGFTRAMEWLNRAEQADARHPLVWANRAIVHYYQGEYVAAWKAVERAESLDNGDVDPRILQELSTKMPRPTRSERVAMAGQPGR